jgi:hypothetical protein
MGMSALVNKISRMKAFSGVRGAMERRRKLRLRQLLLDLHAGTQDPEAAEVIGYIRARADLELPLDARPAYAFVDAIAAPSVLRDQETGMPVASINGRRVFFPRTFSDEQVRQAVTVALAEQHELSPHAYLPSTFELEPGGTAVLAGASDGIFCLQIVDRMEKIYLFEPNAAWHEPLRNTLGPWGDRTEIVGKYLGASDTLDAVTLDTFLGGRPIRYLQADVEGYESGVLKGAASTIRRSKPLKMSICCYHNHGDAESLHGQIDALGVHTRYSRGYFVMGLRAPYLRRAVIYGEK